MNIQYSMDLPMVETVQQWAARTRIEARIRPWAAFGDLQSHHSEEYEDVDSLPVIECGNPHWIASAVASELCREPRDLLQLPAVRK